MLRTVSPFLVFSISLLLALPGCGSGRAQWEVTVENKGDVPCSFFVTLGADGNSNAKVEGVAKGKATTLIVGDVKTVVQSIKVVREKAEQSLTPKVELPVGERYAIVVGVDGKVETSVSDR